VLHDAGHVSKERADEHAEAEYEWFAIQRRALLEAEGAAFNMRTLEEAAQARPLPKQSGG